MSTTRFKKTILRPEQAMQLQLIQLRDLYAGQVPELRRLFAVPNGGYRTDTEAGILKGMGQVAGVPDLELPVLNSSYTGLHIELKAPGKKESDEQRDWIAFLRSQGRCVQTCESVDAAWLVICWYLRRVPLPDIAKEVCRFREPLIVDQLYREIRCGQEMILNGVQLPQIASFAKFAERVGIKVEL